MNDFNCPICGSKLIWGNDFDTENDDIVSVYSCSECDVNVYVTGGDK